MIHPAPLQHPTCTYTSHVLQAYEHCHVCWLLKHPVSIIQRRQLMRVLPVLTGSLLAEALSSQQVVLLLVD